jgi:multidrug transporter EmrE-like cation transporter
MKAGMMNDAIQRSIASGDGILNIVMAVISSTLVLCGLTSFGVSVIAWLYVLSKMDVSQAYPAVALGIAITALGGFLLFGEPINGMRVVGIAVIVIGVAMVAVS